MSVDWPVVRLEELVEEITVGFVGSMTHEYVEEGIPFLRSKNISAYEVDWNDMKYVSEKFHKKLKKSTLNPGDVAIVRTGKPGTTCVVPDSLTEANCSDIVIVRVDDSKLNAHYLSYFMNSVANNQVNSHLVGAVQQHFNVSSAKKIEIPLPSREEQEILVKILKDLDDKRKLNRQTNQTLEHIAQALFKSWFVDFEPTRAKIEAKQVGQDPERAAMATISGKTVAELGQLDAEQLAQLKTTAALFPDGLVESELGEVPEGWEVKNIDQIATRVAMGPFGSNIKTDTFVSEGVPMINGQQLRGIMLEDGDNKFITPAHADKLIKCNAYRGDIVITHRGTLGQVSIIPENSQYERYIVSQSQCYIRPDKEQISSLFLVYYLNSYIGQHELMAYKSQVGVPSIAKPVTNIRKIQLVVPRKNVLDCFHSIVSVLHRQISERVNEINTLSATRDTLLPKLLSGELSPTQAEVA